MNQKKNTYLFVFRAPADAPDPSPEQMQQSFQQWMAWIQGMKDRGQYITGEPLEDEPGKVLRGPRGGKVTDGPFVEAKEVVGGFILITADSFDEAVAIAKGCPGHERGGSTEVRQIRPMPRP